MIDYGTIIGIVVAAALAYVLLSVVIEYIERRG